MNAHGFIRPRSALALLAVLLMAGLTFNLGQWQTRRAAEKMSLHAQQVQALAAEVITLGQRQVSLDELAFHRVRVEGRWLPKTWVYLDNRQVQGRPAVQVIQAFQPKGQTWVIPVDRGYLLRNPAQPRQPPDKPLDVPGMQDVVELQGTLMPKFAQAAELWGLGLSSAQKAVHTDIVDGAQIWSNFNAEEFQALAELPLANYVLTLQPVVHTTAEPANTSKQSGYYVNAVQLPEQVAKHRGYAFQWFALSAVLLLMTAVLVFRQWRIGRASALE